MYPVPKSCILYNMMSVSFNTSTTCVTCGAGTVNPSGATEFTSDF